MIGFQERVEEGVLRGKTGGWRLETCADKKPICVT